jgi:hypothetical protein
MRTLIMVVIVLVVGVVGYMARTGSVPGSSGNPASANAPIEASATLWPHEIHMNYKGMKELPVHDVKDEAF